jgi:hypothetical protein
MSLKYLCAISLWCASAAVSAAAKPRNVVRLVVDDFGAHDFRFAGSPVFETPRIDAFVAEGCVSLKPTRLTRVVCLLAMV